MDYGEWKSREDLGDVAGVDLCSEYIILKLCPIIKENKQKHKQ